MSLSAAYKLYAVQIAAGTIAGIQSFSHQPQDEEIVVASDGAVDPEFVAMMQQMPVFEFETTQVATALGYCGIDGYAVAAAATMYWQKIGQGGTRAGASSHYKMEASKGLLLPLSIQASQGQPATIRYRMLLRSSNGILAPVAYTASQTLDGSPAITEIYTLGPYKHTSTFIDGITDWSLDFGLQPLQLATDGHVYPVFCGVDQRQPVLSLTCTDVEAAMASLTAAGSAVTSDIVWLRHKAAGGVNVPDGTSTNISFTIDEGRVKVVQGEGSQEGEATATIEIRPTYDGTNDIVAIDTTAAIA